MPLALLGLVLCAASTFATDFTWNGTGNEWTNVNASSIWVGTPATYPNTSDNVLIDNKSGSSAQISARIGWGADTLTIVSTNSGSNQLRYRANGTVNVINLSNTVSSGAFQFLSDAAGLLTLREWNDLGSRPTPTGYAGGGHTWAFTNAAQITYVGNATNTLVDVFDFTGATGVTLKRNGVASPTTSGEVIRNGNQGASIAHIIGRNDNGTQNWTVPTDSHPLLLVDSGWGIAGAGIKKVGSGAVNMGGVDWLVNLKGASGAFAIDGQEGAYKTAWQGTVTANSFAVDSTAATANRQYQISGRLGLDGQSGQQGGASGNGHAFAMVTGNNNLTVYLHTQDTSGNPSGGNKGRLEVAPGGGDIFVNSTGTGLARLEIFTKSSQLSASDPILIGNTLNLASSRAYITDRSYESASHAGGAHVELRGSFLNASTQTSLASLSNTTMRLTGSGVFEAPAQDLGVSAPLSGNAFQLDRLVLTNGATYSLANFADNDTGVTPEAVYVKNFEIWNNATLDLRGLNLYFQNGGGQWYSAVNYTNGNFAAFESQFPAYGDSSGMIFNTPEPSTLLLFGVGGWLVYRARKRG